MVRRSRKTTDTRAVQAVPEARAEHGTEDDDEFPVVGPGVLWCPGFACSTSSKTDGYRHDQELDIWVHTTCGLPAKMYYDSMVERGNYELVMFIYVDEE